MIMETIKLYDLYGSEVRSRINIEKIKDRMDSSVSYIFDMDAVMFISRSVADELCNIKEAYNMELMHMNNIVANMISIVSEGRSKARKRKTSNANIIDCNSMDALSEILLSMK